MKTFLKLGVVALLLVLSSAFSKANEREEISLARITGPEMNTVIGLTARQALAYDREYLLQSFMINNAKMFTQMDLAQINAILPELTDAQLQMVSSVDYRDPTMMLVLSILVGGLGVDRFMLGDTGLGVLKLITGGGLGIWWLIDIFTVENRAKEYNMEMFNEAIQNAKYMLPSAN